MGAREVAAAGGVLGATEKEAEEDGGEEEGGEGGEGGVDG